MYSKGGETIDSQTQKRVSQATEKESQPHRPQQARPKSTPTAQGGVQTLPFCPDQHCPWRGTRLLSTSHHSQSCALPLLQIDPLACVLAAKDAGTVQICSWVHNGQKTQPLHPLPTLCPTVKLGNLSKMENQRKVAKAIRARDGRTRLEVTGLSRGSLHTRCLLL